MQLLESKTIEIISTFAATAVSTGMLTKDQLSAALRVLRGAKDLVGVSGKSEGCLITLDEAAKRLRVCKKTVSRMYHAKELGGRLLRPNNPRSLRIYSSAVDVITGGEKTFSS